MVKKKKRELKLNDIKCSFSFPDTSPIFFDILIKNIRFTF